MPFCDGVDFSRKMPVVLYFLSSVCHKAAAAPYLRHNVGFLAVKLKYLLVKHIEALLQRIISQMKPFTFIKQLRSCDVHMMGVRTRLLLFTYQSRYKAWKQTIR